MKPDRVKYTEPPSEFAMVTIPVLLEAVGAVVFIGCSILLVMILATTGHPV